MQWIKTSIPFNANGRTHQDTFTAYTQEGMYQAIDAGGGTTTVFCNEELCHWVLGVCTGQNVNGPILKEPNYRQKVMVIEEIGKWKTIALEVMPPEMEVIDREDVYHLWEFQYPYSFHYGHRPIMERPDSFDKEIGQVKYHIRNDGRTKYIYLQKKDGKELTWREKQDLKNRILSPFDTAVEIITREMLGCDYTCLVCLPRFEYLDFGLT